MDKELIDTAHEIWAAAQLCPGEGVEDGAQRVAEILARIDAERGKEAAAWALFSENGNIRIWTSASLEVKKLAEEQGLSLSPLYTAPQPHAPCHCECGDYQQSYLEAQSALTVQNKELRKLSAECDALRAEIERMTQKNAELREKLHDEPAQHVQFMLHDHPKALAARDATIAQQAERIAELEGIESAFKEWIEKSEWVQKGEKKMFYGMLGIHRADCMRIVIERQAALIEQCEKALVRHVPHELFRALKEDGRWFIHSGDDICEVSEQEIELDALAAIAAQKGGAK